MKGLTKAKSNQFQIYFLELVFAISKHFASTLYFSIWKTQIQAIQTIVRLRDKVALLDNRNNLNLKNSVRLNYLSHVIVVLAKLNEFTSETSYFRAEQLVVYLKRRVFKNTVFKKTVLFWTVFKNTILFCTCI